MNNISIVNSLSDKSIINDDKINNILNIDLKNILKNIDDLEIDIINENNICKKKINNYKNMSEQLIFCHHNLCKKFFNK